MDIHKISNHSELLLKIDLLKAEKSIQEKELIRSGKSFISSYSPASILKDAIWGVANDKETKSNMAEAGLNMAFSFLINKILGKYSIAGMVGPLLASKIKPSKIKNILGEMSAYFNDLVFKKEKEENI
jgi:hypothetical protein